MNIIQSIDQLKTLANRIEPLECFILIGGCLKSSKLISYDGNDCFYIFNYIDDSEQYLTTKQLVDPHYSNIGEAISKKSLIMEN